MENIKLGLQIYSVREAFAEDSVATLQRIGKMGYDGVELNYWSLPKEPAVIVQELKQAGLECLGCMALWKDLQPDVLEDTLQACKILGASSMVIAAVEKARLLEDPAYPKEAVQYMNMVGEKANALGICTGYHSHDMDSTKVVADTSFYEYVMDHTPEWFSMVIDTGNIMGGGDDPIALLKKYPGRTPVLHLKGYSQARDYLTPLWESELDMEELLTFALDHCGTKTIMVEFGQRRGDYEPFVWAEQSLIWLRQLLQRIGRI